MLIIINIIAKIITVLAGLFGVLYKGIRSGKTITAAGIATIIIICLSTALAYTTDVMKEDEASKISRQELRLQISKNYEDSLSYINTIDSIASVMEYPLSAEYFQPELQQTEEPQ